MSTKGLRSLLLVALVCIACASCIGASGEAYPEVKVASPLDKPGVCHHCGAKIDRVADANLSTVGAAQYVTCSDKCKTEIRAWHESQFGK